MVVINLLKEVTCNEVFIRWTCDIIGFLTRVRSEFGVEHFINSYDTQVLDFGLESEDVYDNHLNIVIKTVITAIMDSITGKSLEAMLERADKILVPVPGSKDAGGDAKDHDECVLSI